MEELGFNFEQQSENEKNERIWNEKFQRLEKYKREHGDCLVPSEDEDLSIWVQYQRTNYNCGTIPNHRLQKLEQVGFVWSIVEESEPQQLVFEGTDEEIDLTGDEIDLSGPEYAVGDAGCTAICKFLNYNNNYNNGAPTLCMLDLEANGLSWVGGSEVAGVLRGGAVPGLTHLNIACNSIGGNGAAALANALSCCPLLLSLDLHGNAIGDDGCVALGAALAAGTVPSLEDLDLSANRIEDRGCAALAPLFGVGDGETRVMHGSCCPLLTHLNLRENGIESITALFGEEVAGAATTTLPLLTLIDLSWNCITNFGALSKALAFGGSSSMCPSLLELDLKGNSLSDAGCARLCRALQASSATPLLKLEDTQAEEQGGSDSPPSGGDGGEGRLRRYLRLLADGDATNSQVCQLALWEEESSAVWDGAKRPWVDEQHGLQAEFGSADEAGGSAEMRLPFELLRRDGFVVRPPLASAQDMTRLAAIMERLESAGWPPVFCFMNDAVWDFVAAQVWPVVRTLLGVDCVLDSGSAFAWSLKATGKSTYPRDGEFRSWQNAVSSINPTVPKEKEQEGHRGFGSSFGLPHRDYSAADSLYREDEGKDCLKDAASDHPAILNVWIPLNDATLDNGCMYVVPREFDEDFSRTDSHHAHMNPATEVQRGKSSKIHFPLHGVRALPAPAGSLIAWYGNTIHWGSSCSRYAKAPRKSIALTFRRGDIKVGAGVPAPDDAARIVHRSCPPINITQASDMTPALRLALISRSLLLYNQWHALADDAVPPLIFETTAVPEERQRPVWPWPVG
jgi:hypothetical protein